MKVGIYARVSTTDQKCEQQLTALREYVTARGWAIQGEYVDQGVSGTKSSRPALDRIMEAARLRKIDMVIVWKLDRWGRSIQHLVNSVKDLSSIGVSFIALTQGIDTTESSATGRLMLNILSSFADFERDIIVERTNAGLARSRKEGKIGGRKMKIFDRQKMADMRAAGHSLRSIANALEISVATTQRLCKGMKEPVCS